MENRMIFTKVQSNLGIFETISVLEEIMIERKIVRNMLGGGGVVVVESHYNEISNKIHNGRNMRIVYQYANMTLFY